MIAAHRSVFRCSVRSSHSSKQRASRRPLRGGAARFRGIRILPEHFAFIRAFRALLARHPHSLGLGALQTHAFSGQGFAPADAAQAVFDPDGLKPLLLGHARQFAPQCRRNGQITGLNFLRHAPAESTNIGAKSTPFRPAQAHQQIRDRVQTLLVENLLLDGLRPKMLARL